MQRSRSNAGLYLGFGCLGVALGPLIVFVLLQWSFGLFAGNNGLGLGLWAFLSSPVVVLVLVLGALRDDRKQRSIATPRPTSSSQLPSAGPPSGPSTP